MLMVICSPYVLIIKDERYLKCGIGMDHMYRISKEASRGKQEGNFKSAQALKIVRYGPYVKDTKTSIQGIARREL